MRTSIHSLRPLESGTALTCFALQIHFFAHLTIANVVSTQSMYELLRSFTAVLDEFGVSYGRAKRAALCAAEGLMIVSVPWPGILVKLQLTSHRLDLPSKRIPRPT